IRDPDPALASVARTPPLRPLPWPYTTLFRSYTAIEQGLEVMPVLNKIDLPQAEPERVKEEIESVIGIDATDAVVCSAKSGIGVEDVLERLIEVIPPPEGEIEAPLQALII